MSKEHKNTFIRKALSRLATVILPVILTAGALAVTGCGSVPGPGSEPSSAKDEIELLPALWPEAFNVAPINEPPFVDSPDRTNNAFNVQDFGEQGTNGWFYRYGNSKRPQRSRRLESFDGEKYFQIGVSGLEIKKTFLHTADRVSPILEWRVAEDGAVNVTVTYVKSVNGDQNPSYPDGVQLMVYKGSELLKLENVPISTEEETLAQITIEDLDVIDNESLYFVVDPKSNNAFDGGSLYIAISDVDAPENTIPVDKSRSDNNANSVEDFGEQGSNGWAYLYGTDPDDCAPVSHENDGEYINATSPNLSISQGFQHPALNHNAVLGWTPAVNGNIDLRIKYTKFEQHDGNPDFPDGVTIRAYKNDDLLYEKHVDAPDEGENKIKYRVPKLYVDTSDRLYFMIDAEGNSSYDGGAFDITIIDIRGAEDESDVYVSTPETRQNFADVKYDFGEQGSNGWIFQWGYEDDPYHAYNAEPFDYGEDRYFYDSYLEIKRDYVNPGTHDRSAIIKWRVAQNGTVSINASYTKMKNEDANPAWPDGTRVSLYHNGHLRRQQYFAPEVNTEVTKRLDIDSEYVEKGDYLTLVINGLDNTAYDGGKYEFSINSLSGLVGEDEDDVRPWYNGKRVNFASTLDDFDGQGYNGWYYQFGYYCDPFFAVNVERCENGEKYYTSDGVEIKKDFIVPGNKGKSANVKWIAAETGKINIDLEYTKLRNEDANPSFPDGVTVYLMRNNTVLREEYFSPRTDREVTKSLAIDGVSVSKGDAITMIVDPGENNAYDGGKYMFVIEDTSKVPVIKVGNHDNSTSLRELPSIKQGTDGWWFLEGTSPGSAKVLTKMVSDSRYGSRRTEGLEMGKDFVHTGATRDPIYLWIVGQDGKIDVTGSYMKYGQEDPDPSLPDGVTVTIRHGSKVLLSKKVNVYRGDGNNNVIDFSFDALSVRRGDWLTFQISADNNYAWDGGQLSVVVEPTSTIRIMPGEDNWTVLREIPSVEQGTDGWYFFEGNSPDSARLLTKLSKDKSEYTSRRTDGLSVKKDFVHTGAELDPIYEWVVARNGDIDIYGTYTKYGQEDQNPDYPDGVTVIVRKNDKVLLRKKVKVLKGDGNNNVISFHFDKVAVKRADRISFQISRDKNYAWDGGQLSVVIEPTSKLQLKPGSDNNTVLGDIKSVKQGTDGWYFYEGTSLKDAKPIRYMNDDKSAYVSKKTDGLEMKKDYVHPGAMLSPIYRWVVAKDGEIDVFGRYIKYGQSDENPDFPDGVTLTVSLGDKVLLKKKVEALQGDGNDNILDFSFEKKSVKRGDVLSFQISCDKNNAWDAGQLAVAIEEVIPLNRTPGDDNNTVLGNISSMEQGTDGWWFLEGTALANVRLLTKMNDDKTAYVSKRDTGLEMKKDYVHPGTVQNPYYQWVVKDDGVLDVQGSYVKFGHNDSNPDYPDGVTLIISHNDKRLMKKQVDAFQGDGNDNTVTFSFKDLEVKSGDIFSFRIMPNGNNAYDAGRLNVVIGKDDRYDEVEPDPNRTNNTVLKDSFGRHGTDGWYYGMCEWDSTGFEKLPYDSENNRYYNDGKPELKADFVEPGSGKNAAYKWVVAKDGTINVKGDYTKFANSADDGADGTTVRFFLNGQEKKYIGMNGRSAEDRTESFDETYEVKAGDILIFAVNPEGNDSYDGGRLSIEISDSESSGDYEEVEPDPDRTNNTVLKDSFGRHGTDGWYYGMCAWDSTGFEKLPYDSENNRYYNNGKPELKADFVEPGSGKNAAYKWVVAKDGTINVKGDYTKFANSADDGADGTTVRFFLNGQEKKYIGMNGRSAEDRTESFDETYEVKAGDILIFAVNPEGNDSYDGGRLSIEISDSESSGDYEEVEPDPDRTNNTVLKDSFGRHGTDGWYYGMCAWDGAGFEKLPYDSENNRYYNNGKPELKADYVEPGSGKNAAYKWVVAKDGTINVKGDYTKFANSADDGADGTTVRFFLNGQEKKYIGTDGRSAEERTVSFDETYEVKAGDILIFAVNPEGNDSYDGGRLSIEISDITDSTSNPGNGGQISSDPSTPAAADAEADEKKADDKKAAVKTDADSKDADKTDLSGNGKDDASEAVTAAPAEADADAEGADTEETDIGSTADADTDHADDADAESTDDEGAESADDEDTEETGDSVSSAPENKGPGSSGEDAGPMKTTK